MSKSIILIGESGTGKSLLGNYLLNRNKFKDGFSMDSITKTLQKEAIDMSLSVIDMPGVYDSQNTDEKNFKEALDRIKNNPDSYKTSLVLIVLNFANPRFNEKIKKMIKFICELFPKDLGKHVAIVFTHYIDSLSKDEKFYKKKEYVPKIMNLISEYTGETEEKNPNIFFLDSKLRDENSDKAIKNIKDLARRLSVIQKINFNAKPPSLIESHYYPVYCGNEDKKEEKNNNIEEKEESPDFFEKLYDMIDSGAKIYTGYKYSEFNSKYSKGKSNSVCDFFKGVSMYNDIRDGRDDDYMREKYSKKKDDDCIIV